MEQKFFRVIRGKCFVSKNFWEYSLPGDFLPYILGNLPDVWNSVEGEASKLRSSRNVINWTRFYQFFLGGGGTEPVFFFFFGTLF
jgi:hypothetical protein